MSLSFFVLFNTLGAKQKVDDAQPNEVEHKPHTQKTVAQQNKPQTLKQKQAVREVWDNNNSVVLFNVCIVSFCLF